MYTYIYIYMHDIWHVITQYLYMHSSKYHNDVIMNEMASQITSLTIVYWTVVSDADPRTYQSSALLAFMRGIHQVPLNSPHKWPVTRKIFPSDDVIMDVNTIPTLPETKCSLTWKKPCRRSVPLAMRMLSPHARENKCVLLSSTIKRCSDLGGIGTEAVLWDTHRNLSLARGQNRFEKESGWNKKERQRLRKSQSHEENDENKSIIL